MYYNQNHNDFDDFLNRTYTPPENQLVPVPISNRAESSRPPREKKKFSGKMLALILSVSIACSCAAGVGSVLLMRKAGVLGGGGSSIAYLSANHTSTASPSAGELTIAEIAALAADSVVEIQTESVTTGRWLQQAVTEGAGSGVIITTDGKIVTNNHVIEGASKITVRLRNGEEYAATLVATDSETDVALLKIDAENLQPAVLGNSESLQVGETVVAIGNPLGELGGTVTDGIISALDRDITLDGKSMRLLQTNAAINPGNSGGGLFNGSGELIGIVVAKSSGTDVEGLGFAIPIDLVTSVVEELDANGYVKGRIDLGLELLDIDSAETAMLYRVSRTGLYVQSVTGTNASEAGFQSGDCIVAVNGTQVASSAELSEALSGAKVGDTVEFTILRNGRQGSLTLTLAESKGSSNANNAGGISS